MRKSERSTARRLIFIPEEDDLPAMQSSSVAIPGLHDTGGLPNARLILAAPEVGPRFTARPSGAFFLTVRLRGNPNRDEMLADRPTITHELSVISNQPEPRNASLELILPGLPALYFTLDCWYTCLYRDMAANNGRWELDWPTVDIDPQLVSSFSIEINLGG